MAYTWADGELITAEKLNNTGNEVLIVKFTVDESTFGNFLYDTPYATILNALASGKPVFGVVDGFPYSVDVLNAHTKANASYDEIVGVIFTGCSLYDDESDDQTKPSLIMTSVLNSSTDETGVQVNSIALQMA